MMVGKDSQKRQFSGQRGELNPKMPGEFNFEVRHKRSVVVPQLSALTAKPLH